ncbi:hypothetical protein, partial [Methylicorpusculum sp.]|uniref:hypothetical protein n=1 Tax=Methylicorpusculum sp. TaxID=2713644 RepID=UPI00271AFF19
MSDSKPRSLLPGASHAFQKAGHRGVAIFAKACFGHPSPIKQQKNTRPLMPPAAPIRPRRLVSTQQGVE